MEFSSIAEVDLFCPNDKRRVNGCVGGAQLAPFLHPPSSPPPPLPNYSSPFSSTSSPSTSSPPSSSKLTLFNLHPITITTTYLPSIPVHSPFTLTLQVSLHFLTDYISFMMFLNGSNETSSFHSNIWVKSNFQGRQQISGLFDYSSSENKYWPRPHYHYPMR